MGCLTLFSCYSFLVFLRQGFTLKFGWALNLLCRSEWSWACSIHFTSASRCWDWRHWPICLIFVSIYLFIIPLLTFFLIQCFVCSSGWPWTHFIYQAGLNPRASFCLSLLHAEITAMHCHAQHVDFLMCYGFYSYGWEDFFFFTLVHFTGLIDFIARPLASVKEIIPKGQALIRGDHLPVEVTHHCW